MAVVLSQEECRFSCSVRFRLVGPLRAKVYSSFYSCLVGDLLRVRPRRLVQCLVSWCATRGRHTHTCVAQFFSKHQQQVAAASTASERVTTSAFFVVSRRRPRD